MIRSAKFLARLMRRLCAVAALGSLMGGACQGGAASAQVLAGEETAERGQRLAMRAPLPQETAAPPPAVSEEEAALAAAQVLQVERARRAALTILALLAQGGPEAALLAEPARSLRPRRTSRAADGGGRASARRSRSGGRTRP